jgi:phage terminase large subunit
MPDHRSQTHEHIWGLDFGFNVPTALVEVALREREAVLAERIYRTHLTNSELIDIMKAVIPEDRRDEPIFADNAEPNRIAEISAAGFNIYPADKDVAHGIDATKHFHKTITKESANLLDEIRAYSWRVDKSGNILDIPVKFRDHAMDAIRYAIYTYTKGQLEQIKPDEEPYEEAGDPTDLTRA